MPSGAAGVVRTDMSTTARIRRWLGRLRRALSGATVVLHESIANRYREVHAADRIRQSNHLPECDRIVAAVTPAQLRAFVDCRSTKDLGSSTREFVAHPAAITEPVGEDVRGVDAVVVLDQFEHVVDELQILPPGVGPASVQPIGGDENSSVLGALLQSKMGHF